MKRRGCAIWIVALLLGCGDGECTSEIRGRRVDTDRGCLGESETLACAPAGTLCAQLQSFATDEMGSCFLFPDRCVPPGFAIDRAQECPQVFLSCSR